MSSSQSEGYFALPSSGIGDPVLVLHAWWGLNGTIKGFCRRLATKGFVAFAPDLYHGKIATTIPDAEALGSALDSHAAETEVADAAAFLSERAGAPARGIAVIGFSLGSAYAFDLSANAPERVHSVVSFYGAGEADFSEARAEYLGHFAERDEYEPIEYITALEDSLKRANRPVTFHRYPGVGHWFFEPDRPQAYNADAAALAWDRTLAFLKRNT